MFIGHFGIGLGAKKAGPRVSLGTLFLASQFLDLLWPTFLLLGWERVRIQPGITKMTPLDFTYYPFSHSLAMAGIWGTILGFGYYLFKKDHRGAIVVGCCVLSHWALDFLVHRRDLPLFPGNGSLAGLGLWNHPVIEVLLEGAIFVVGLLLYLRTTKAKNNLGKWVFWTLISFLVLIYLANILGSPPPNVTAIAWVGQAQWLVVLWAYWADRNRISAH